MRTHSKLKLKANGYTFTPTQIYIALAAAGAEPTSDKAYDSFITTLEGYAPPCPKCRGFGSVSYEDCDSQTRAYPCECQL